MNKASRMKDKSKVKYYGAFASALSFIVHCGNQKNSDLGREFVVYRGLQLPNEDLKEKFRKDEHVNLTSFTSTSLSQE